MDLDIEASTALIVLPLYWLLLY